MTKLLGEEIEEDEAFWNQEALKDVLSAALSSPSTSLFSCLQCRDMLLFCIGISSCGFFAL